MIPIDDKIFVQHKYDNYLKNYKILLKQLSNNIISRILISYINFLQEDNDIYIHKFLFQVKLIDIEVYRKLEDRNLTVLELATTTEFELAKDLEIPIRKSFIIKIIAQFHYVNLFDELTIYYAHPLDFYIDSIESQEIELILKFFPFAHIINPSKFEPIWKSQNLSKSQIMEKCLELVSECAMVIFSPFNDKFIGKGVYKEVSRAENLNLSIYIICDGKLQDYSLGDKNEDDWKNFCAYKPISLIKEEMIQTINDSRLLSFIGMYKDAIQKNIIENKKKIVIACNNTYQLENDLKDFYHTFKDSKIKIIPIVGKTRLCTSEHIHEVCESNSEHVDVKGYEFFEILKENILKNENLGIITAIKKSTPEKVCSYSILYEFVDQADIILLNKIFFKSIRLRTKLRKKILFNNPFNFIAIFDNISDIFNDNVENRCSDKELQEGLKILKEKNTEKYVKARLLIQKMLDLREGDTLKVEYTLSQFLLERYKSRTENTNILEPIFEICKTPFGVWQRQKGEILQIIDTKSLKIFLNFFFKVYIIEFQQNQMPLGSGTRVRI